MATGTDETAKLFTKTQTDAANATSVALIKAGYQLGLYKAMGELDEFEPAQLAQRTGTIERYIRDWLINQTAAGYVSFNNETGKFYLNGAQKDVFVNEASPRYCLTAMVTICGLVHAALTQTTDEMRTGAGVPFGAHERVYIEAIAGWTQPLYRSGLVKTWIPACVAADHVGKLSGGEDSLVIADIGCGYGGAIRLMAKAFAQSHVFIGFDTDEKSVEGSQKESANESLSNCLFAKSDAHHLPAPTEVPQFEELWKSKTTEPVKNLYDIIVCLNTLHDLQDPLASLVAARAKLEPVNGTYIAVEPFLREPIQANFDMRGQLLTSGSITWCTPAGNCARDDGIPKTSVNLGSSAPDSSYEELAKQAGFSRFRKVPAEMVRLFVFQV